MHLKLVNKQSLYIIIVTLLIAILTVITVHGISKTISSSSTVPITKTTEKTDSVDGVKENLQDRPESIAPTKRPAADPAAQNLNAADTSCKVVGCNKELCVSTTDNSTVSSCNNQEINKCYRTATCAVQIGGKCGWTPSGILNRCIADSNFATQTMRVLQIKFISDPLDIPNNPDDLSLLLRNAISDSSTYHKYKDSLAKSQVNVQIVENITVNGGRENVENYWYGSYYNMIQSMGLCQKIKDEKIDQIWMWVDPRDASSGPGLEYAISSKFFLKNNADQPGVARPPFCLGESSFVIMGFDYTSPFDNALHSFGHYMESLVQTVENPDLFGQYEGTYNSGTQSRLACGNVHFPPNGTADYDYSNLAFKNSFCQNWDPNNTSGIQSLNCSTWGCTQEGYMKWWYQNMPGFNNTLTYQGRKIPSWWDFTVDFDVKIAKYNSNSTYYVDNNNYNINNVDLNSNCSCNGVGENGSSYTTTQCWESRKGLGGNSCYTCTKDTMYQVPMMFCNN